MAALQAALTAAAPASARLVSLTGVAGVGKSRLAAELALTLRGSMGGAVLVDLAAATDDDTVTAALAAAGLQLPNRPARPGLLVLDNCDGVLDEISALVTRLAAAGQPGPTVLVTARRRLGLSHEHSVAIRPMCTAEASTRWRPVATADAVALFSRRAHEAWPDLTVDETTSALVTDICTRLEGLPRALELAAARLRVLSVRQLGERLDQGLLTRGPGPDQPGPTRPDADAQTFERCSAREQRLWSRLSVFVDGWRLEDAEAACTDHDLVPDDVVDGLHTLVEHSVVIRVEREGRSWFRMLATTRAHGTRMLVERGEYDAQMRRLGEWCERLLQQAHAEWMGPRQAHWLTILRGTQDTVRAVLDYHLDGAGGADRPGVERALRLLTTAWWSAWYAIGRTADCLGRLDRAIALAEAAPEPHPASLARAMAVRVYLSAQLRGPLADRDRALASVRRAREVLAGRVDPRGPRLAALSEAIVHTVGADNDAALLGIEAALAGTTEDDELRAALLIQAISAARGADQFERAAGYRAQLDRLCDATGATVERCLGAATHGIAAWHRGEYAEAETFLREALGINNAAGDLIDLPACVELLAAIATDREDFAASARLSGTADTLWRRVSIDRRAFHRTRRLDDEWTTVARARLGPERYQELRANAGADDPAQVLALVRPAESGAGTNPTPDPAAAAAANSAANSAAKAATGEAGGDVALTRREHEIADLIAEGLSNRQIAARLYISVRTAEGHVERIRAKLGVNSRSKIMLWKLQEQEHAS